MKKDEEIIEKYFKTKDLHLATFLFSKEQFIIAIENDDKRKLFVFSNSPRLKELTEAFNFGDKDNPEILVDARKILWAYREVKNKIFNS